MNEKECCGLYIHVPFCLTKCPYCDFYSITERSQIAPWLTALCKESLRYRGTFTEFDSLYLGGGTPSLLLPKELTTLMASLRSHFVFSSDTEITIEANPDDLTKAKLEVFRDLGINRLSLGVQSFDEDGLRTLRRRHNAKQGEKALEMARLSGFTNVGVDLIYGFPGHTAATWRNTLKRALQFEPEHLSCYQMTYEEGTPWGEMAASGRIKPQEEEEGRAFYLLTSRFLEERGYLHYEISNFARGERYFSRHNCKYWRRTSYLGLGPGAHSLQDGTRWWNVKSVHSYCDMLDGNTLPVADREVLSSAQNVLESLYLGFRTKAGVDRRLLYQQPQWVRILKDLERSGLVRPRGNSIIPTREGFLVADSLPLLFSP